MRILSRFHKNLAYYTNNYILKINDVQFKSTMSQRPKIYVTRKIDDEALNLLKMHCEVDCWSGSEAVPRKELLKNIENIDGLFCLLSDKIDKEILDKAKKLKVISTMSVGYDHLDIEEIKKCNIKIGYTPEVLTDATAELTISLLLATTRRLIEANNAAKTGEWSTWSPYWMCGLSLKHSVVGIVGFGRIGQEIARRLSGFKLKNILYTARTKKQTDINAEMVDFDYLLENSDIVIACCSLNDQTKEMFNKNAFKKMKNTSVFINTARGGVVNQDDLVEALKNGTIWGAGLDVTTPEPLPLDHPLFKLKNCTILPHIGSAAMDTRKEMAKITVENILAALKNQPMPAELK